MVTSQSGIQQELLTHTGIGKVIDELNLSAIDLTFLSELSPYLILDGHRTGIFDYEQNPTRGYMEGAKFALRFSRIFQEMGGKHATFLIHTLRNHKTQQRIANIFGAVSKVGNEFIKKAKEADIKLSYFGSKVHSEYSLAGIINKAEAETNDCKDFNLNFLTNYSEKWANDNVDKLNIPEISVIGRFTKGHYSGAGIPGHAEKANFMYIQQASVSENWTDEEIMILILSLLKSHLALKGYVGGKTYNQTERDEIRQKREIELFDEQILLTSDPRKRITSFSPSGPINVLF